MVAALLDAGINACTRRTIAIPHRKNNALWACFLKFFIVFFIVFVIERIKRYRIGI